MSIDFRDTYIDQPHTYMLLSRFPQVILVTLTKVFYGLQVKIWFQNRRMKLKKELRAVKEINEQVRREREETEKMKDKDKSKDSASNSSSSSSNGSNNNNTSNSNSLSLSSNGGPDTPTDPTPIHGGGGDIAGGGGGGGLSVDGKIVT